MAQDVDTLPGVLLDEVDVVALKQSDRVRSSATTVAGQQQLERERAVTVRGVGNMVPNLFIPDYGSRMTSSIYVRGLGARIDQPALGFTVDGIPVLCKENYDFDVQDLSRAEVLRGPQSTLFGRNTMGGLMNITTLSPLSYNGFRVLLETASHATWKAGASLYTANAGKTLGLMAGLTYSTTDGQWRNDYNGRLVDHEQQYSARLKGEWRSADGRWHLANSLFATFGRQGGYPYEYQATGRIAYNDTCFYKRTSIIDGLTLTRRFNNVTLSSITSYQYIDDNMTLDQDFTVDPYFTLTQARREHAVTEDLVVKGTAGDYRWLAGAFAFYRRYRMDAPVTFKDTGIRALIEDHVNALSTAYPIAWDTREFVLGSHFTAPGYGFAAYHESTCRHGAFSLTAGLRLDYEHARLNYHSFTSTGYSIMNAADGTVFHHDNIDIDDSGTLNRHFLQLLPKVSLSYGTRGERAEHTLRLTWSKGYKAGGFNTQMFSDVLQQRLMGILGIGASYDIDRVVGYDPEMAWNYEAGYSLRTFDGRLAADLALFYIDCRDRQLTTFPDGTTTGRVMTNAGRTRSLGAELSLTWRPLNALELMANYGWCRATFVEYNDGVADYSGKRVPYCPEHTLYGVARYTVDLNVDSRWCRSLAVEANVKGAGRLYWNEANTVSQPFYALLGASLTLEGSRGALQLWATNLTGTRYNTFYFISIRHEFLQRGNGRAIGATLRMNL